MLLLITCPIYLLLAQASGERGVSVNKEMEGLQYDRRKSDFKKDSHKCHKYTWRGTHLNYPNSIN